MTLQGTSQALLIKQILKYAPGALAPAVVGLIHASVFTRIFKADEFGRYSLVLSLTSLFALLASQWLQQGIGRYMPGQDSAAVAGTKKAVTVALALITLGVGGVSCIALLVAQGVGGDDWKGVMWPASLLVIASSLFAPLGTVLQAQMRAVSHTSYQITNVFIRLALAWMIVFFLFRDWSSLLWAQALGTLLIIPFMWRDVGLPGFQSAFREWGEVKDIIRQIGAYGIPMIGWFLASTILNVGDRFFIQWFRGATEVGIYSANYSLVSRGVGLIAAPILLAAHPLLMKAWGQENRITAGRLLGKIVEWFSVTGILLVGAFSIFARDVSQVFLGSSFHQGYLVMPIVLAGEIFWQLGMYTQKPLEFAGRTKVMLKLGFVCVLANILMNFAFVPMYGYFAAACTTLASYILYALLTRKIGKRYVDWDIPWVRLSRVLGFSVIGFISIWVARQMLETTVGVRVAFLIAAGCTIGFILTVLYYFARPILRSLRI